MNTYTPQTLRKRAFQRPFFSLVACLLLFGLLGGLQTLEAQSFGQSNLNFNGNGGVSNGTSLMFGPDGRLYVLNLNGTIDIFTIQQNGPDDYVVTDSEELLFVKNIPNHNDDGSSNSGNNREATGITLAGTAENPVIYVTSSDARVGGPSGDANLDTNSGVITRLIWTGTAWDVVDIVRGLPRSEENHATNGLEFVNIGGIDYLIVASGGHANAGAPSDNFAWTTEYALSAAVLAVNLTMLETMPILNDGVRDYIYDIPTLDDPTRPNANGITDPDNPGYNGIDVGDPWGGNDGLNQAMLVQGGPVQIFSPGYRNTYDLVVTQDGKVFITDNGANGGWGGLPENEGLTDASGNSLVTNNYDPSEPGSSSPTGGEQVDNVDHLVMATNDIQNYTFGSFYGGHPTPVRANPVGAGLFTNPEVNSYNPATSVFRTQIYDPDGSTPGSTTDPNIALPANWPPVPPALANPVEGDWRGPTVPNPDGPDDVLVTIWGNNTNGIDEYTSTIFAGSESMVGDLIAGKNGGVLRRVELNPDGSLEQLTSTFASNLGGNALGITCNNDSDPFPGTIWVATFNSNIVVLEPKPTIVCIDPSDPAWVGTDDTDGDGYSNQDEVDSGSDQCNGGSQPNDFDKVAGAPFVSDLNDLDDDNDGIPDADDVFQLGDPEDNGSDAFDLPVLNDLLSDNPDLKGYLGLGFTGLMNNGDPNPNYLEWLDVVGAGPNPNDILGGAVGAMTIQMTEGTALGTANSQEKAFQYGVNVDQTLSSFTVEGRLFNFSDPLQVYGSSAPANGEIGLFIGDGTQSNYIKFVINQNGLQGLQEIGDVPQTPVNQTIASGDRPANAALLFFVVTPSTGEVSLQYKLDDGATQTLTTITAEGPILAAIQDSNTPLAVGLIGSSNTPGVEVEGTWDYLYVQASQPTVQQQLPNLSLLTGASPSSFNLDEYFSDDGGDTNLTYSIENNTDPAVAATINGSTLNLVFPSSPASSDITVRATDGDNLFVEQTFTVTVSDEPVPILRIRANGATIAAADSSNPDWIGVTATGAQSGTSNGFPWAVNTGNHSTHNISGRDASVPDYVPQELFANECWDPAAAPEMEWTFDLPNETFLVRLYMGNGFGGTSAVGQRVFDISIEGNLVQNDLDLVQTFGHQVGGMLEYQVTLTDGTLNILFEHVVENPLINGIEILSLGGSFTPPLSVDPIANQSNFEGDLVNVDVINASGGDTNENFGYAQTGLPPGLVLEPTTGNINGTIEAGASASSPYAVTITVSKSGSDPVSTNFSWTVLDPNASGDVLYRVNAGGAVTASNNADPTVWSEDQSVAGANGTAGTGTPSPYLNSAAEDVTFGVALPATFTNNTGYPDVIFATERYNTLPVPDNMQWDFPVANGSYTVNLLFAEVWTGAQAADIREFDVEIEGTLVLDNYDQTELHGWATAAVETFTVEVTDANLDIDFIQVIQNPAIKGIEIIPADPPTELQWADQTDDENYTARHEASFVQAGDKFYLFGGRENSQDLDVYDYQTKTWSTIPASAPKEFNHFQATEYQGLIWVIGAFQTNNFPDELPADFIWTYNPATDIWIQGPEIPDSRKRGSSGLVMYNDKFYVIGGNTIGHNGGYIPWFDEFDPATGTWTPLADAPRARDHFHAAVIGDKLYLAGGRLSGGDGGTFAPLIPEVDVYDFTTGTWTTLPAGQNLPTPRGAASVGVFQNELYVIGGEIGTDLQGNVVNDAVKTTESYNPTAETWTTRADMITERHGTQAIVSGDGIHITAGSNSQGGGGTMKNMEYYGADNPVGTPLTVGQLSAATSLSVPVGGSAILPITHSGGNTGVVLADIQISGNNASNFDIISGGGFGLVPVGGSLDLTIAHNGSAEAETAGLTLSYGDGTTIQVALVSSAANPTVLYRVNTGGPLTAATDSPSPDWEQDEGSFGNAANSTYLAQSSATGGVFSQTSGSAYQGAIDMSDPSLPAGTPSALFQTERFDVAEAPEMLWQFPVTAGSTIEVRLYFAELFNGVTAAGQRVFDVSVEGTVPPEFNDIDPFGRTGALGAFMLSHTLTVTDDVLDITFIHDNIENPAIKAIEIIDTGSSSGNLPPVVTNPGTQQGVDGDLVNLQILASDENACEGLTYQASGLPASLSIDPATGLISGTLDAGTGSGTPGAFIEENGLVVIEMENNPGISGNWKTNATTTTSDNINDPGSATGGDFIVWEAAQNLGNPGVGLLTYPVEITTPGVYRFQWRNQVGLGTSSTEHNDTWLKIEADAFYGEKNNGSSIVCPNGLDPVQNDCTGTTTLNGSSGDGWFKIYASQGTNWGWSTFTSDNDGHLIYARFDQPGTYNILVSARSSSHVIDRMVLSLDSQYSASAGQNLSLPQSAQNTDVTPGASANSPYDVTVTVSDQCDPALSSQVNFSWNITAEPVGNPEAFVSATAGAGLTASTFGNNSFLIQNTGDDLITNVTITTTTGYMMDVVFDPVGTAGDNGAKCLTEGSNSVGDVGITVPADGGTDAADCESVFALPHNGVDNQEGYDQLSLDFTDFDPGEAFAFGVDMDPTSIKGDLSTGDAGSISGFEIIGATVEVTFASGATYTGSLFDEGSLGGSDVLLNANTQALSAPSLEVDGLSTNRVVTDPNQTVTITGNPGSSVVLLQVDGRLYIDPGNPNVGYDVDPFEANEAMAKVIYTAQLDGSGTAQVPVTLLQTTGATGTPNGGLNHFIAVTKGAGSENSLASNTIVLELDPKFEPEHSALVEITPDTDLGASTFSANSFQITNTSSPGLQITGVSIDLSTGILPDMVFDPVGSGGDATASCLTPNTGAVQTGFVAPADPCVDPFSQPRNGGFDIMTVNFSQFDPGESFEFTTDVDPNSIQGVAGAGNAGAVSGYELIGATITISFSDGTTLTGSLYEDGSLGGSQVLAEELPTAPSISMVGIGAGPGTVNALEQTVEVSGTPGDYVSLLQMDSRLYIASGDPPFNVPDETYYANEAMSGKSLYAGQIPAGGVLSIPVTLLQTTGASGTPDGGLNQFIAVSSTQPYAVDQPVSTTSNVVTVLYDPNFQPASATLNYTLQGRDDYTAELSFVLYEEGQTTPLATYTVNGDATGQAQVSNLPAGTYQVAVKQAQYLQRAQTVTLVDGANTLNFGELLAGDANDDNQVTALDFSILAASFNLSTGGTGYDARADFNGDGSVTALDFSLLASNFNVAGEEPTP